VRCLNPISKSTELSQLDLLKALIVLLAQVTAITFAQTRVKITVMATRVVAGVNIIGEGK